VSALRRGVRLGVDVGDVRIGLAVCDPDGVLATPLETVPGGRGDIARIADLAQEVGAVEIVVGLPLTLSGRAGTAATKASAFSERLACELERRAVDVSLRLFDERMTTVSAERVLREQGKRGADRRSVVDQAAAVIILQHAIDTERMTGVPAGSEVRRGS
jgi:putative Holliday junction resolvase